MDDLLYKRRGALGLLTLNRPERLNALDYGLIRSLLRFFADCADDLTTRVLVLTGAGRAFCAGLDMRAVPAAGSWHAGLGPVQDLYALQQALAEVILRMRRCPQPLVAAIPGAAVGGGFSLALACDVRLGTAQSRFACSFLNLGLGGGDMGTSYFLPKLVGPAFAAELLYSGRLVEGVEAQQLGLLNRLVEPDTLQTSAVELGEQFIARASPFGLRLTKEVLNETVAGVPLEAALKLENRAQILAGQTADAREAVRAFAAREQPQWRDA